MQKFFYSVNNWLVDSPTGSLIHLANGEKKRLGEYQIKLLEVLLENAGRIMSREELTALVWERRVIGSNSLPNAIHALRAALEDDGKQQRIIKTLPKKGYILEAEYCTQVEKEESEVSAANQNAELTETFEHEETEEGIVTEDVTLVDESQPTDVCLHCAEVQHMPEVTALPESTAREPRSASFRLLVVFAAMALSVLVATGGTWLMKVNASQLTLSSRQQKVFDHITLYEVKNTTDDDLDQTDMYLFSRLRDTYTQLNQALKARSVDMTVYYHYVQQTLNYTFVLKSRCEDKETILYFYHWHSDNAALNRSIFDNTMSTLNEMATCK
ncbi:winged helix-turn-helix domain-containing protein [Scandinavium sp. NPDC088450]|uniref:winged helix-turn-helix domain-containing protein n=1 Tax=Scandinavium sp. NPDC088450 TaxID=3364514 RepID=UPI00384AA8D8